MSRKEILILPPTLPPPTIIDSRRGGSRETPAGAATFHTAHLPIAVDNTEASCFYVPHTWWLTNEHKNLQQRSMSSWNVSVGHDLLVILINNNINPPLNCSTIQSLWRLSIEREKKSSSANMDLLIPNYLITTAFATIKQIIESCFYTMDVQHERILCFCLKNKYF